MAFRVPVRYKAPVARDIRLFFCVGYSAAYELQRPTGVSRRKVHAVFSSQHAHFSHKSSTDSPSKYLLLVFFLSEIGWYIPGISELPLGRRLLLLLEGESLLFLFFFSSFCVRACVPRARHRGRARRRRGYQRARAGKGGGWEERGRRFRG